MEMNDPRWTRYNRKEKARIMALLSFDQEGTHIIALETERTTIMKTKTAAEEVRPTDAHLECTTAARLR